MIPGQIATIEPGAGYQALETHDFVLLWKGFLFVRGCSAGEESGARILAEFRNSEPSHALALGKGSFALCVVEKQTRTTWYAVDPFGLMRLFASEGAVTDDFFGHVRRLGAYRDCIDSKALAAFFRFGFYNRQRTLDRRIRVLSGSEIIRCADGAAVRLRKQSQAHEAVHERFDFDAYVRDLGIALRGQRISLDLTGGFDSRLVAACLVDAGAPIAESVTSGQEGSRDAAIAKHISTLLGLRHVQERHEIAGFESRAIRLLRLTHGQTGILTYDHMFQIQQGRVARGMTLGIGGAGGELWKDFLWLQDFPRLSGTPAFERLYNRRFEPRQPSGSLFVEEMSTAFADAKAEYVGEMYEHFGNCSRTEAYDRVYADLRLPFLMGPSVTGSIGEGIPHFSPLLDREGVNSSIRGPHRERLFSRWHRRMIARVAPELARQRTTEGLSARNGPLAIIDVPFYVADKIGRAAQKVAQRFNLPDIVQHAVEDPQTLPYTQELGLSGDAIRRARDFGILSERVASGQLSRAMFDRVLTAGLALLEMMP